MAIGVFVKVVFNFLGLAALLAIFLTMLSSDEYDEQSRLQIALLGVGVLLLKNIIVYLIDRATNKYLLSLYAHYSAMMLNSYYHKGLLEIRKRGVTTITRDVNAICFGFVYSLLNPMLRMAGEGLLLIMMLVALFIYSAKIMLLLLALFIPLILFYHFVINRKIGKYGKQSNDAKHNQWLTVEDVFKGYIEVRINQAYGFFLRRFNKNIEDVNQNQLRLENYRRMPSSLIEMGMALLLLLVVVMMDDATDLKVFLGIFAVAAFKVLPSVTSLVSAWMQVKTNGYTADIIADLREEDSAKVEPQEVAFTQSMKLENISFKYPDNDNYTIRDFSMEIKHGEIVGIGGSSGGGKTTLLNIMQGFLPLQEGSVIIDGVTLDQVHLCSWHKRIAYVPQEVFIMEGTVAENIALDDENVDNDKLMQIIERLGLSQWFRTLPSGLDSPMSATSISGGERQRIGIARALYRDVDILFLDEITSALDSKTEAEIVGLIEELYRSVPLTIVMVSHRKSTMAICNKIIEI